MVRLICDRNSCVEPNNNKMMNAPRIVQRVEPLDEPARTLGRSSQVSSESMTGPRSWRVWVVENDLAMVNLTLPCPCPCRKTANRRELKVKVRRTTKYAR
jgi:hypothetical protein